MLRALRRVAAALVTALLVALATPASPLSPASAAGPTDRSGARPADDRASLEAGLVEVSKEERAALSEVLTVRAERERLDEKVAALDGQVQAATARAEAADRRRQEVAARYLLLTAQLRRSEAELREAKRDFEDSVASLYRSGASGSTLLALVSDAESFHDLTAGRRYLRDASAANRRSVRRYLDQRTTVNRQRDALAGERSAATAARAEAERERARVAGLRAQEASARDAVRAVETRESAALAAIQARKAEFTRQLAQLDAESKRIGGVLRGRPGGGSRPGSLRKPADGPYTSPFGWRRHPIFGDMRFHSGVDIGAGYGAPVHAAAGGVVAMAGPQTGYGNAIVIDHGGGLATLYGHLSRIQVRPGQQVSVGQTIGAVGNSGYSTGPHLHFEVRVNGNPVDPMGYL